MPIFKFMVVAGLALIALLFVANVTLGPASPVLGPASPVMVIDISENGDVDVVSSCWSIGIGADFTSSVILALAMSARYSRIPFATPCRADDVTSLHHTRFFRTYVIASTAKSIWLPYFTGGCEIKRGISNAG